MRFSIGFINSEPSQRDRQRCMQQRRAPAAQAPVSSTLPCAATAAAAYFQRRCCCDTTQHTQQQFLELQCWRLRCGFFNDTERRRRSFFGISNNAEQQCSFGCKFFNEAETTWLWTQLPRHRQQLSSSTAWTSLQLNDMRSTPR